jgi:hypothetical protein
MTLDAINHSGAIEMKTSESSIPKESATVRQLLTSNFRLARFRWKNLIGKTGIQQLKALTQQYDFSIAHGDIVWLERGWYVTNSGLVRLARRCRCAGIHAKPVPEFCNARTQQWAFEATVYKSKTCRGFVGYGDADPSNVSLVVHGAEMRVAETRAVNRALRKAYGIGICSVDEIRSFGAPPEPPQESKFPPQSANSKGNGHTVRDRLCQLIRQHQLDPNLVKAYAADFCGVRVVREATREQVENFVQYLAEWADKDRNALLCQLNSYLGEKQGAA